MQQDKTEQQLFVGTFQGQSKVFLTQKEADDYTNGKFIIERNFEETKDKEVL